MNAGLAWALGACVALGSLTWLLLGLWEGRVRREMARERAIVAALDAQHDAQRAAKAAAEAQRMLLLHEVNHRARNALSIVQALVRLSSPRDRDGAQDINGRIAALASAHDLLARRDWAGTDMAGLAAGVLAPFQGKGVVLQGDPVLVPAPWVQAVSMVLHELATNAAKHGALSAGGLVELGWWQRPDALVLRWREVGGPSVAGRPQRSGVGTRVIDTLVQAQLRGRIRRDWDPGGLVAEIEVPRGAKSLAASRAPAYSASL